MTSARAAVVSVAFLAFGCGGMVTIDGPDDVEGQTWRLRSLEPAGGIEVAPPAGTFTIRFRPPQGRLEIQADCNGCSGTYDLDGDDLVVRPVACTRAFCPSAPFDTEFVRLAQAATRAQRADGGLVLTSPAGKLRFDAVVP